MLYCKTFASIFIGSPMQNVDKAAIISESATNHCTSYIPQGFTVATDKACVREQRKQGYKI